jgi:HK97 gp10 family phage protein
VSDLKFRVEFKGMKELGDALKELEPKTRNEAVRAGLKLAGEALAKGMAERAPRAAEHRVIRRKRAYPVPLAESILSRVRITQDEAFVRVGPSKGAFWGKFQEQGTRFMPAQPFMQVTAEGDFQIAVAAFMIGARERFDRIVRRLARRAE